MTARGLLQDPFEEMAEQVPDRVAWMSDQRTLSYGELNHEADKLARHLRERGIGHGDVVGLFLERGPDLPVAIFGVLKAGAAYLPIGVEESAGRRTRILGDSRPRTVIVHQHTRDRFADDVPVLDLDERADPLGGAPSPGNAGLADDAAAYIIYTSGSTGTPKGVVVEHRNLAGHIEWLREHLPLGPGDRLLQVAPYTFDASMTDVFWPLTSGATVVSVAEGDHLDPLILATTLARQRISAVRLPPAIVPWLLKEPVLREATDLRYLICGGDRLPASLARRVADTLPWVRLFNRYGPTEAAVAVTYHEYSPGADDDGDVPIGGPVDGAELYVADDDERVETAAPGRSGELLIGGAPVARGYLGDETLTASRFIELPGAGRVFRTGDWVRVTDAGMLFAGRRDEQVQVAGNRVELGEVRAALAVHPSVQDCAITLRAADQALTAYVVAGTPAPVADELRAFLRERLPRYMVPSRMVFLERLPVNERGKVELAALELAGSRDAAPVAAIEPDAGDESPVRRAWREAVGTADGERDFFAAGGTSLQAAMLANRLRALLAVPVTVSDILSEPSLDAFERLVGGLGSVSPIVPRRPDGEPPVLSHLQERLWFMYEFTPDEPVYNFQAIYHFTGDLDETALRRSLTGIVERHEVLRTTFPSKDGVPRQVVHPAASPSLTVLDLREAGVDPGRAERTAREFADRFIRAPFDLGRLPLVRWCLIRLDDQRSLLVHSQNHLTHDGWSFSVFLREFLARYRAELAGAPVDLPEPVLQCGDFAYWQRRRWDEDGVREHLPYWLDRLRGVPPLGLPLRPRARATRGQGTDQAGTQVRRRVTAERVREIKRVSAGLDVTPFMFCFAAWTAFLWTLTGQQDFAVGTAVANRSLPEAEHMLGCVLNNIPVRTRPEPGLDFRTLVGDTRQRLIEGYAHADAPLQVIVEALQLPRTAENPIFQTTFNFHDAPFPDLTLPGVRMALEEAVPNGTAKFPIDIVVLTEAQRRTGGTGPDEWDMVWNAAERYFDADQAAATADRFLEVLAQVAGDPGVRLSDLRSSPAEARSVRDTAVRDAEDYHPDRGRVIAIVHDVWSDLLKVTDLADDDNLFDRGGHSLLAMQAIGTIGAQLGRHVPVRTIFEYQTVRTLSDAIVSAGDAVAIVS